MNKIISIVPKVFQTIYGEVAGTYRNTENQKYMDSIPSYRLIHITELESDITLSYKC